MSILLHSSVEILWLGTCWSACRLMIASQRRSTASRSGEGICEPLDGVDERVERQARSVIAKWNHLAQEVMRGDHQSEAALLVLSKCDFRADSHVG